MTADLAARLCLAAHRVSSGARWCCNLPPGHPGLHDDGCGDRWDDPPSPQQVVAGLQAAGFTRADGRNGEYVRMWWPEHVTGGTMLVTLNPDAEEYDEEMAAVRRGLEDAAARGRVAQQALDAIGWTEADR